jgi:hypothetical protein
MKNRVLMRSINTLYFRQNNSLILKLTSGQRKTNIIVTITPRITLAGFAKALPDGLFYKYLVWNIGDKIIGPHFFRERLNGLMYLHFLLNILSILLEEKDLHRRQKMWLQQDGAPPHFHRDVRSYLGSINSWPPRSPGITPLQSIPFMYAV